MNDTFAENLRCEADAEAQGTAQATAAECISREVFGDGQATETPATKGPLEWSELWNAMQTSHDAGRIEWIETTESMFDEMLGCVPPRRQVSGGFLVGEANHHNDNGEAVYAAFTNRTGRFEACYLTVAQFRKLVG